jgi:hypothetical protein
MAAALAVRQSYPLGLTQASLNVLSEPGAVGISNQ